MNIDYLLKTKYEQVVAAIEHIHYEHTVDAGAMWGTLTESEARHEYTKLLNALPNIPNLTDEERKTLAEMINAKIAAIPQIEAEQRAAYEEYEGKKKVAFEEAKQRFASLSSFEKLRLKQMKQDPEQIDVDWLTLPEIDQLYRKKM